jgi:primary-amine oxidase
LQVVYNHQVFDSVDDFVSAYKNGTLVRMAKSTNEKDERPVDRSWSSRQRPITPEGGRDLDNLPGPRSISLAGLRFRVDREAQYISWMGWGFYLGFDREMGMSLWDVRFKNERIAYEVRNPHLSSMMITDM